MSSSQKVTNCVQQKFMMAAGVTSQFSLSVGHSLPGTDLMPCHCMKTTFCFSFLLLFCTRKVQELARLTGVGLYQESTCTLKENSFSGIRLEFRQRRNIFRSAKTSPLAQLSFNWERWRLQFIRLQPRKGRTHQVQNTTTTSLCCSKKKSSLVSGSFQLSPFWQKKKNYSSAIHNG